jgi:hypothetical protein
MDCGNKLYEAGSRSMKSGLASMIPSAEAIRASGSTAGDLVIACVLAELRAA